MATFGYLSYTPHAIAVALQVHPSAGIHTEY